MSGEQSGEKDGRLSPLVAAVAGAVKEAGGRAFLVGGWVRELVTLRLQGRRGLPVQDEIDLEVYGLAPEKLAEVLGRFGRVNLVGESFAVYKVVPRGASGEDSGAAMDVSLPRRDSKVAPGHRGFEVQGDPFLSLEEATRRRDFTVNAMLHDPLTEETIDLWKGEADIKAKVLRAVDPLTFAEDSLRVLRAVQFAARLGFGIDTATVDLCRGMDLSDLSAERVRGEVEKLLLRAERPSLGLEWADRLGVVDRLFPELAALKGCPQDPGWHPEGDVWRHTLLCVDRGREECSGLGKERQMAVMLALLCHDFGKPRTTAVVNGRIRSMEHEEAGVEPTHAFLDRLDIHSMEGFDLRGQVVQLVAHHLTPSHFYKNRDRVGDGAFRRLARKLELDLLHRVCLADNRARTGEFDNDAQDWFIARVRSLGVEKRPPAPVLMGRHLLALGLQPGPIIGRITRDVYEMQLDGRVTTLEEALAAARRLLGAEGEENREGG